MCGVCTVAQRVCQEAPGVCGVRTVAQRVCQEAPSVCGVCSSVSLSRGTRCVL